MIPAILLPQRDFLRFWWARLANTCASQMLMVAVGWQMYDLTGSAWDLGLVGLLQFLPALALVLVTGDVVDRHHRARLAAACVGVQAAVALVLALAPWAGGKTPFALSQLWKARANWCMLLEQDMRAAASRIFWTAGSRSPMDTAS